MPPLTPKGGIFYPPHLPLLSGKLLGIDSALLPNRGWNQKQKPKKQPWGKVECFAFGGATVRFASLETSFHAANHTIPPPPSNEGCPLCPKDKNRSPFHGEKTPDGKKFLGKRLYQISQTILHGMDATIRIHDKRLILNALLQFQADVMYHVPTIAPATLAKTNIPQNFAKIAYFC